jgi:hypothetical protein
MGETVILFLKVTSLIVIGENNSDIFFCLIVDKKGDPCIFSMNLIPSADPGGWRPVRLIVQAIYTGFSGSLHIAKIIISF